ncbi:MAG: tRNA (adenosine(37)-N6)-threonylcarbamoyltransferase complex dimerization subunit type 1 TsaB [Arenicellales bacterium]
MRVLAIDTVTEMCSVALSIEGEMIVREVLAPNQHSNIVLEMVDSVMDEAGAALNSLDLIINDTGPGSFTGIRIGMGVSQGLAYGADIPMLGVDALSTLAHQAEGDGLGEDSDEVLVAMDARMGQVYWAYFTRINGKLCLNGDLHLTKPDEIKLNSERLLGIGSGMDVYAKVIFEQCMLNKIIKQQFPLAQNALKLGLALPESDWVAAGDLLPVYLRNDVAKVSQKSLLPKL